MTQVVEAGSEPTPPDGRLRAGSLEAELLDLPRYAGRVVAREAGAADRVLGEPHRLLHPLDREVVERRRSNLADYLHLLTRATRSATVLT